MTLALERCCDCRRCHHQPLLSPVPVNTTPTTHSRAHSVPMAPLVRLAPHPALFAPLESLLTGKLGGKLWGEMLSRTPTSEVCCCERGRCVLPLSMPSGAICTTCPPGQFSPGSVTSCANCPANTYSTGGASSCTNCTVGYFSVPGASTCYACAAGTAYNVSLAVCQTCQVGQFALAGAVSCTLCPPGQYNTVAMSSNCTSCNPGYSSPGGSVPCGKPLLQPLPRYQRGWSVDDQFCENACVSPPLK